MKEEEVNRCQIQEWYPRFKSVSIKTVIHELPESFINYLLDDSGPFVLPLSISDSDALPNRIHKPEDEEDYTISSDNESEQTSQPPPPSFPELESQINESIKTLGGAIFPKLNWSSPKDSAWISPNASLKCTSFSEVTLLLKSSDSLVHDLCHAYDSCTDCNIHRPARFFLALRKCCQEPEFRIVESQCGVRPGLKTAVPYDYLDTSEGSGWDQFLRNANEELKRQTRSAGNCYVGTMVCGLNKHLLALGDVSLSWI
ncbi:hypothetical protein QVD17_39581 [Tagetes erecta]|uniref:Cell division cycle protein 123 homolog n=1 Tax=Tagetes erecta TaxID=13708 RepID=A0AAD8JQT5_TARER|nr:hypothetical protein QVD17_39581 [Tagetes erecta]